MKTRFWSMLVITAVLCFLLMPPTVPAQAESQRVRPAASLSLQPLTNESFSVKEYEKFHDILQPLQHEALPNKNFAEIRLKAAELVKRGKAMVKIGVPAGATRAEEFRQGLKTFKAALDQFSKDAKRGNDTSLEKSFSAVHDSFETLAEMLPRK